jgi:hypothetical protein
MEVPHASPGGQRCQQLKIWLSIMHAFNQVQAAGAQELEVEIQNSYTGFGIRFISKGKKISVIKGPREHFIQVGAVCHFP